MTFAQRWSRINDGTVASNISVIISVSCTVRRGLVAARIKTIPVRVVSDSQPQLSGWSAFFFFWVQLKQVQERTHKNTFKSVDFWRRCGGQRQGTIWPHGWKWIMATWWETIAVRCSVLTSHGKLISSHLRSVSLWEFWAGFCFWEEGFLFVAHYYKTDNIIWAIKKSTRSVRTIRAGGHSVQVIRCRKCVWW